MVGEFVQCLEDYGSSNYGPLADFPQKDLGPTVATGIHFRVMGVIHPSRGADAVARGWPTNLTQAGLGPISFLPPIPLVDDWTDGSARTYR